MATAGNPGPKVRRSLRRNSSDKLDTDDPRGTGKRVRCAPPAGRSCAELSLTSLKRSQLDKLEEQISDPDFWNQPEKSQKVMQDRKRLEESIAQDSTLASAQLRSRHPVRTRARRRRRRRGTASRNEELPRSGGEARNRHAAVRRERRPQRHHHHPSRRRRHRKPGLGRDAAAHVPALGGTQRLRNRHHRPAGRRRRRHQIRHLRNQRRERLRHAAVRDRSASPGAHFAVRRQRAPPHLVRFGVRLSAD